MLASTVSLAAGEKAKTDPKAIRAALAARPLAMYLFAGEAAGGFVDPGSGERSDSVRDIREHIEKCKVVWCKDKQPIIRLVDTREESDIAVEVMARGHSETGSERTTTIGNVSETTKDFIYVVTMKIGVGDYSAEVVGKSGRPGSMAHTWRDAAQDAELQIVGWIIANYARLEELRKH